MSYPCELQEVYRSLDEILVIIKIIQIIYLKVHLNVYTRVANLGKLRIE